jgi:hypothetical protein
MLLSDSLAHSPKEIAMRKSIRRRSAAIALTVASLAGAGSVAWTVAGSTGSPRPAGAYPIGWPDMPAWSAGGGCISNCGAQFPVNPGIPAYPNGPVW